MYKDELSTFRTLAEIRKKGWWKRHMSEETMTCGGYLCSIFGLKEADDISFDRFFSLIRSDYRNRIRDIFMNANTCSLPMDITFPFATPKGDVWVHAQTVTREPSMTSDEDDLLGIAEATSSPEKMAHDEELHSTRLIHQLSVISNTLASFLHPGVQIRSVIDSILRSILNFYDADRAYIFELMDDNKIHRCTYEVVRDGVPPEIERLQNVASSEFPWWTEHITSCKPIMLNSLDDLPDEASHESELLSIQSITSMMILPFSSENKVWGYVGIDIVGEKHTWSEEDYQWLSSMRNIISICLEFHKKNVALLRSENFFKGTFNNLPIGVALYTKEGNIITANSVFRKIYGSDVNAINYNLFRDPNVSDTIREKVLGDDIYDFRVNYHFKDLNYPTVRSGSMRIFCRSARIWDEEHQSFNLLIISMEETDHFVALNKIHDFENLFSMISDYAKVGYVKYSITKKEGYAIRQWYKNFSEDEHTPLSDIIGSYSHVNLVDRMYLLDFYEKALRGAVKEFSAQVRVRRDDSEEWKWIQIKLLISRYAPEENEVEIIGVNYDITSQKKAEAELIEARNRAQSMDKLKSAFIANMSHEIRTPLNAIVGFSNLLIDEQEEKARREYVDILNRNSEFLLQLISDILDLSKIESGTLEFNFGEVDVNYLCQNIVRTMQPKVKDGVELIFDHHLPECVISSDRTRLSQVLNNFVSNAIKYTPQGSIKVGYNLEDDFLCFYVSDTGIGIKKENQENIFERFVKLNNFVHGTGLGLSICKNIVERLSGKIGVVSEYGKGSCFWFTIPFIDMGNTNNNITLNTLNMANEEQTGDKKKIVLVAEDTDSNYLLVSAILHRDYQVEWARDGVEAVSKCRELNPDIILMDIRMPRMTGLEATIEIRKFNKEVPILAVTAYAFEKDRIEAIKAGCNDFVTKPILANALREKIKQVLG